MSKEEFAESLHATAIRLLIDEAEKEAATMLLRCSLDFEWMGPSGGSFPDEFVVMLKAPYDVYKVLNDHHHPTRQTIERIFRDIMPYNTELKALVASVELANPAPNWRAEFQNILIGVDINNQLSTPPKGVRVTTWNNLRFRSATEVRIAQALDRLGVLFLPNCKARLGRTPNRQNREADFLICHEGHWGILEVDGDAFHPPTRTAEDHERDRLFQSHGILFVQHFAASECWENADGIVRKFLELLKKIK
jgi:hypothetical protein